jgi:hypothetical protein
MNEIFARHARCLCHCVYWWHLNLFWRYESTQETCQGSLMETPKTRPLC